MGLVGTRESKLFKHIQLWKANLKMVWFVSRVMLRTPSVVAINYLLPFILAYHVLARRLIMALGEVLIELAAPGIRNLDDLVLDPIPNWM